MRLQQLHNIVLCYNYFLLLVLQLPLTIRTTTIFVHATKQLLLHSSRQQQQQQQNVGEDRINHFLGIEPLSRSNSNSIDSNDTYNKNETNSNSIADNSSLSNSSFRKVVIETRQQQERQIEQSRHRVTTTAFQPIRINVGSDIARLDRDGNQWMADTYYIGGTSYTDTTYLIVGTALSNGILYQSERHGISFQYEIPVPIIGAYEVKLLFAELYYTKPGQRIFHINIEGKAAFTNFDILRRSGGTAWKALSIRTEQIVTDGSLSISFEKVVPQSLGEASLAGIEINLVGPHLAHADAGGPYLGFDTTNIGSAYVRVTGSSSHTHAPNSSLKLFVWMKGTQIIGRGRTTNLNLPVGSNTITLRIVDSNGNESRDTTTVIVRPHTYPMIRNLSPSSGRMAGNTRVLIWGSGFTSLPKSTIIKFGTQIIPTSSIRIFNATCMEIITPAVSVAVPTSVIVRTPFGESNIVTYTYIASQPIKFIDFAITGVALPSAIKYGPDRRLYIGTGDGKIIRLSFHEGTFQISSSITAVVAPNRAILGLTFDPLDVSSTPRVYFSHNTFFHGDPTSSSGLSINGKISAASGSNLDIVVDIITGLPVSDHDHGLNGIEFGDNGELYIQVGGSTNAGIPGKMTGKQVQKENVLSAATLVAYLSNPKFDGNLRYDAMDNGNLVGGWGIEVFASGQRNAYDLVVHSNGNLYGTDNGMNIGYGNIRNSCSGEELPERHEKDKINLLVKGRYYGHPNAKRGEKDPRQCRWYSGFDNSTADYTAPIIQLKPSSNGMIEYEADHFDGQLRGNLIISRYRGGMNRVILSPDGKSVIPESIPPLPFLDGWGLSLTQAPSGEIIEARYDSHQLWLYNPVEIARTNMVIQSVFPTRGREVGGHSLFIYGTNMYQSGVKPSVHVGGRSCPVKVWDVYKIECTLPLGIVGTRVDVKVTLGKSSATMVQAYRYIKGY